MLSVNNLTRSYNDFVAVDNVSFTINKGEIIGLLGHNGAGKTTIMKMISGYLEADIGSVYLDDISLSQTPKLLQQQLGYLPENLPVYPEMTVAEYLDFAADLKGINGENKHSEIARVIKETDISEKLLSQIQTLSRGYKQRVGVAQALLGKPKLLILDEPTNGLDPEQTQHMRDLIKEIAKNATVILSTHIMQEVNALCDRVIILKAGQLIIDEKLSTLKHSKSFIIETNCEQLELIEQISGVVNVETIAKQTFKVTVTKQKFVKSISAELTKKLISEDYDVYAIYPEKHDLETLFNQINSPELANKEVTNAA